jgi:hypothetical protein
LTPQRPGLTIEAAYECVLALLTERGPRVKLN